MHRNIGLMAAISMAALSASTVYAETITVVTNTRGSIAADGLRNGTTATNNYIAGSRCSNDDCRNNREFRNFLSFALPTFSGSVSSARLFLSAGNIAANQSPFVSYQFTSLAALPEASDFVNLGTGTIYGGGNFGPSSSDSLLIFDLNSAGLAAIVSGTSFLIGGRVTNAAFGVGQPDHFLFGASTLLPVRLEFTIASVPEPASWAMLIAGFGLIGAMRRRQRDIVAA